MIWSELDGDIESAAEMVPRHRRQAAVTPLNGPKVRLASLSKIWLYAGKSEYPRLRGKEVMMLHHLLSDPRAPMFPN